MRKPAPSQGRAKLGAIASVMTPLRVKPVMKTRLSPKRRTTRPQSGIRKSVPVPIETSSPPAISPSPVVTA